MGLGTWYDETVVPKIVTFGCSRGSVARLRGAVVPRAAGRVLEIGCGGGFNQELYRHGPVTAIAGIDPSPVLLERARVRARTNGWDAELRAGVAEDIPFGDGRFDTVVCTYTLCSVADQPQTLAEIRRVLKPGGLLLFLEHGKAPDPGPQAWQLRIEPVWKRMMGNCHLTREIGTAIRRAGFEVEPIGQLYFRGAPRWAGWMEWGVARRAGV